MTRSWIAATLIMQRLRYKGCTIKEIRKTTDSLSNPLLRSRQQQAALRALAPPPFYSSRPNTADGDVRIMSRWEALPEPWPRSLVRELCQFLDAVQAPRSQHDGDHGRFLSAAAGASRCSCCVAQPSDSPLFGSDCSTMARVYRTQEMRQLKNQTFAFVVEKRALKQLEESRKERELLRLGMEKKIV